MEQLPSQGRPRLRARNIGGFVTFFQRLVFCLFALAWGSCLQGQDSISFDPLKGIPVSFSRGAVVLQIPEKVHLKTAFMKVVLKSGTGTLAMGKLPKPTGQDELGDAIWHGTVSVPVSGTGLTGQVELEVTYQPCTEGEGGVCFPPTRQLLKVAAKDIPVLKADVAKGSPAPKPTPAPAVPVVPSAAPQPPASEGGGSALWILCLFFLGGMSASLTPCVLPMIPITMAIIGLGVEMDALDFLIPVGFGMGTYGIACYFIHDIVIHRRVSRVKVNPAWFQFHYDAHMFHHRFNGPPYGFVFPCVPKRMSQYFSNGNGNSSKNE